MSPLVSNVASCLPLFLAPLYLGPVGAKLVSFSQRACCRVLARIKKNFANTTTGQTCHRLVAGTSSHAASNWINCFMPNHLPPATKLLDASSIALFQLTLEHRPWQQTRCKFNSPNKEVAPVCHVCLGFEGITCRSKGPLLRQGSYASLPMKDESGGALQQLQHLRTVVLTRPLSQSAPLLSSVWNRGAAFPNGV